MMEDLSDGQKTADRVESNFFQDLQKLILIGIWSIPGGEMVSTGGLQQAGRSAGRSHNGSIGNTTNTS